MLALTDGLGSPGDRGHRDCTGGALGWLQDLADRLERSERELTAGARHMRAWCALARSGRCLLKLEMNEAELVVGLVERNLLDPLLADDLAAITQAAARALTLFCGTSHRQRPL